MIKIRHKLVSWDEGKAFMNRLADEVGEKIEEIDANLKIENDQLMVSCHFDDRDFSFLLIKIREESMEARIRTLLREFKEKQ